MRDKRPVDELSIEELERILAIRKREARMARLRHYEETGRTVAPIENAPVHQLPVEQQLTTEPEPETPEAELDTQPVEPQQLPRTYFEDAPTFEDELDAQSRERRVRQRVHRRKDTDKKVTALIWNRLLALVEIAAAIGLIGLVIGLFQVFQSASKTTAQIQAEYEATTRARFIPPTSTPVISVQSVVLPSGHKVQLNDRGAVASVSINLDEVPAEYRNEYAAQMSIAYIPPTVTPENPTRIQIPEIKVNSAVVVGDNWEALKLGVGHKIGSANPGQRGNMVLSAHNDVYGEIFRYLDRLEPGDTVVVSTNIRDYTYVVENQQIVNPTDVWVLDSRGDTKQLTLISCYPYQVDNKRIVIFATLKS